MRIVHVASFYGPRSGSSAATLRALGAGYLRAGHEFTMIVPGRRNSRTETPYGTRITVPALPLVGASYSLIAIDHTVRRLLAELSPDRLEVSDRLTMRRLGVWARKRGVPAVLFSFDRPTSWTLQASALAGYDRIVTTTAAALRDFDAVVPGRGQLIPLGVDLETFSPLKWSQEIRTSLLEDTAESSTTISRTQVLLATVGRLTPDKAPVRAIHALRELRRRGLDARLVVAGDGPLLGRLERAAFGLPVAFVGQIDDRVEMAQLLATADLVLALAPGGTFGVTALEALAAGTPVVGAADSSLEELIGPASGYVSNPTPEETANAVEALLRLRVEVRRTEARAVAAARGWDAAVSAMLAVHHALGDEERPSTSSTPVVELV